MTTDLFLEQVHFRRDWHQPEVAGHRCLARGLSDIAAMGAQPMAAFLSFALPQELAGDWASRFLDGLLRLARRHGVPLAGGDTAQAAIPLAVGPSRHGSRKSAAHLSSPPCPALFTADIVLLGTVRQGRALLRSGAREGDALYVTGTLGGAAAELALLQRDPKAFAHLLRARAGHPHLFPVPRLEPGDYLLHGASAAIDISDGLSTDLAHLCEESGVAAEILAARLPIHPLATAAPLPNSRVLTPGPAPNRSLALALHGGEDYELLFTAAPTRRLPTQIGGTPIHRIGTILKATRGRPRITLVDEDGSRKPLSNRGWEHFRSGP